MAVMRKLENSFYEFDTFRLDVVRRLLLRDGEVVPLPPKAFDTLLTLVENRNRLLEKSELMNAIWPDSFVEEANLTQHISILRRALGERTGEHRYIVTVPGRGYRFVASVDLANEEAANLILASPSSTQIVTIEDDNPAQTEVEIEEQPEQKNFLQPEALAKADGKLNSMRIMVGALVLVGLMVAIAYLWISLRSRQPQTFSEMKSIAVLPFKTIGGDGDDEYLGCGLADALITRMSNLKQFVVRPTSSVMKYASAEHDLLQAGRELNVEAVLDGHIQKIGERVRVTAQLVRVNDGKPIWAAKFEQMDSNIFALQDSISENIARELLPGLNDEERQQFARHHTENPEAFQAYLKGRYWWNKRYNSAFKKAIDYFNQAIVLDSNYALAYAGLADCYAILSPNGISPPNENYVKAKESAKQALAINDQLAEAHTSLAHITWLYEWNWPEAEKEFRRAIELNPNYATAHQWYSVYLSSMARHQEAIAEATRAQELDPVSIPINQDLARAFYHARQYDQAISVALKTLELDPNYYVLNGWLNLAYEQKGLYSQAIDMRLKAMEQIGIKQEEINNRREAFRTSGWQGYWQKELELTKLRAAQSYVTPYNFARTWARVGEQEQAFACLEKAYLEHSDHLVLLKVDPIFDSLRSDRRYTNLLSRVGFH